MVDGRRKFAKECVLMEGIEMAQTTFVQLTAPGNTVAVSGSAINKHVFQITLAAKNTSVDVNIEGSIDGTNWFKIKSSDIQYTANGTYYIEAHDLQVTFIRFDFVSEVGGTAATLDVIYLGTA